MRTNRRVILARESDTILDEIELTTSEDARVEKIGEIGGDRYRIVG